MNTVKIDTTGLNRILKNVRGDTSKVVERIARGVVREAQADAAVDTSSMKIGIHIRVGTRIDEGGTARSAAKAVNPTAVLVELPQPPNNNTANVGPCVEHGIFQELGTSRNAAQPFMTPAVKRVGAGIAKDFKGLFKP